MKFCVVNGETVHRVIHGSIETCVEVVKKAYLAHHHANTVNPNSYFLRFPKRPDARIIALPGTIGEGFDVSGIKWISSYPSNVAKGIPRASAVLVLNDTETGYPFACLEASVISAARTAASAVAAAEALLGDARTARTLGIIGTGFIARYLYTFFCKHGWSFDEVKLFDSDASDARRFQTQVCTSNHRRVTVAADAASVVRESEMTIFATTAPAPYLDDPALLAHNPVLLNVSLRDLSPRMILASQNVVDDVDHVMNANTSVHLTEQKVGERSFVQGTLAGLLEKQFAVDRRRPVVFSPFGLGVLDLAVGKWVFDEALRKNEAVAIDNFFFDMTR
jgi:ornithine cyclodeaminase